MGFGQIVTDITSSKFYLLLSASRMTGAASSRSAWRVTGRLICRPTMLMPCGRWHAIAECDAATAERDRLIELNDRLRRLLRKAQGFEAKSERLAKLHADQVNLALGDIEQAIAKAEAIEEKAQTADAPRKRRINRGALPAHLPRIHETIAPADTNCPCCNKKPMHVIGE